MLRQRDKSRFDDLVSPHLDSAFNLACWLLGNRAHGEDVVQEAMRRAYRSFQHFRGDDARAWLLRIVRNACYSWLEKNRPSEFLTQADEEWHLHPVAPAGMATQNHERHRFIWGLESLPVRWREIILLRELEGFSCLEIAEITGTPVGAIIRNLSRAREWLLRALTTYAAAKRA